jgi:hypothetical protein
MFRSNLPKQYLFHVFKVLISGVSELTALFNNLQALALEISREFEILTKTYGINLVDSLSSPIFSGIHRAFSASFDITDFDSVNKDTFTLDYNHWNLSTQFAEDSRIKLESATGEIFFATVKESSWNLEDEPYGTVIVINEECPITPISARYEKNIEVKFSELLLRDGSVEMLSLDETVYDTSMIGESDYLYLSAEYGDITADFPANTIILLGGVSYPAKPDYKILTVDSTSYDNFGGMLPMSTRLNFTENISPIVQVEKVTKFIAFTPTNDQHIATKKYVDDAIAAALL